MNGSKVKIELDGHQHELGVVVGTEGEKAIDTTKLRSASGYICLDEGYRNTGSCESAITFINPEEGILRYRGIPIEELAENSTFIETAYLLIMGELPTKKQLETFSQDLTDNELLHEGLQHHFDGFPGDAHPMAILSSMINAASCYHPTLLEGFDPDRFGLQAARLLAKTRTIAALSHRKLNGLPIVYPRVEYGFTKNFLHMMFARPDAEYEAVPEAVKALDVIFLLHADHEQNCSTSTVRMVASSRANLFASAAAGVCALWGPLHGGANQAVIEMLQRIHDAEYDVEGFLDRVRNKEALLFGFGHPIYRNYDPRAKIIKKRCDELLETMHITDPLLDIAKTLEERALNDEYFVERRLYPNVDFYSGIIMRALEIPLKMFTVMFAIGRMPGYIANYKEVAEGDKPIYRPRQIYCGTSLRHYVPLKDRG